MDDSHDKTGSQLGPYYLDKRYKDLDEPGGQLYAAHHVETGRPALLLVPDPGERWAPRSDWSARVTAQSSPPFLATELERPPPPDADALTDVELAFIRMAGGIASVEDREDAHADFTQPHRPPTSGRHEGGALVWKQPRTCTLVVGVLMLVSVTLWPRLLGTSERRSSAAHAIQAEPTSWGARQDGLSAIGYPMPETALPEQMKPPCQGAEVELRGGCWFTLEKRAPCDKGTAEYEGKCYVPVHEKKPERRSLKP